MQSMFLRLFKPGYRAWVMIWIISIFVLWEGLAWTLHLFMSPQQASSRLPYLHVVTESFFRHWSTLVEQGSVTFGNAAIGFAGGTLLGALLALLMSAAAWIERTLSPYVVSLRWFRSSGLLRSYMA